MRLFTSLKKLLQKSGLIKAVLLIIFFASFLIFLKPLTYDYYPDFSYYYYAVETLLRGGNPYVETITSAKLPFSPLLFAYPPQALFLFLPLSLMPYAVAGKLFTLLSVVSFILSIILLSRIVKLKPFSNLGLFLIILSLNYFPAKFTLGMGQVNNFVLLAIVLFIYFLANKHHILSGIFLAIATLIKVTPFVFFAYLVFYRKWKILFAAVVASLAISLTTYFFVGHEIYFHFFLETLPKLINAWPGDYYNQSLSGFILRSINGADIQNLLRVFVTLLLSVFSLIALWIHGRKNKMSLIGINILIILGLLLSSYSWQHHFVWSLIPLFLTFKYIREKSGKVKDFLVLGVSYFLIGVNLKTPLRFPQLLQSHVFFGAMILYFLDLNFLQKEVARLKR